MSTCRECGAPISWRKRGEHWVPSELDGSYHFDKCRERRTKAAMRGTPMQLNTKRGVEDGFMTREGFYPMTINYGYVVRKRGATAVIGGDDPPWETTA